jgi:pantetheine-phosphate adenylyltransferase
VEVVLFITQVEHSFLTGSTVREIASLGGDISSMVPAHVVVALKRRFSELGDDALSPTSWRD